MDTGNPESIVNLAAALDRLGGDRALLEEVAQLFLDSAPELLDQIEKAAAARDCGALERAAHALKGSVGNFGAAAAFDSASRLEQMAKSGDLTGVENAVRALRSQIDRLLPQLAALNPRG